MGAGRGGGYGERTQKVAAVDWAAGGRCDTRRPKVNVAEVSEKEKPEPVTVTPVPTGPEVADRETEGTVTVNGVEGLPQRKAPQNMRYDESSRL